MTAPNNKLPFKTDLFSMRLNEGERIKYEELCTRALERNRLARQADINRELMGLAAFGLFTADEIKYWQGRRDDFPPLNADAKKKTK